MQESQPNLKPTIHDENIDFIKQMHVMARVDVDSRLAEHWDPTITKDERQFKPTDFEDIRLMMARLHKVASGYNQQNKENKKLEGISRDAVTESLIPQAFSTLLEDLDNEGIFKRIKNSDWTVQVCMIDLDKLGQHNDLGGQVGGDSALAKVTDVLKKSFRRSGGAEGKDLAEDSTLPSMLEHEEQIKTAIQKGKMHDVITRLGGDEFIVISFIPEDQNHRRDASAELENEASRIEKAFSDVRAEYKPIRAEVSDKKRTSDGIVIDTKELPDGSISAHITTTFCVTRIDDADPDRIKSAIRELNQTIETCKETRNSLKSTGLIHEDFYKRKSVVVK